MDRPFLHQVLDHLGAHGVHEVVLSSPYLEPTFGPFLEERVAVLPSAAADAVAQLARAATSCRTFDSRDSDGVVVRFTVIPLALTGTGGQAAGQTADQVVAVEMSGRPVLTGLLLAQAVAVRRGDVVVAFLFSGVERLDPAVMQAAVARAVRTLDAF